MGIFRDIILQPLSYRKYRRVVVSVGALAVAMGILAPTAAAAGGSESNPNPDQVNEVSTEVQALSARAADDPSCNAHGDVVSIQGAAVPEAATYSGPSVSATVVSFSTQTGPVTEVIPPDRWRPSTATPAELKYFGIPQRPTGAEALQQWLDVWDTHFSGMVPAIPCAPIPGASATIPDTQPFYSGSGAEGLTGVTASVGTTSYVGSLACPGVNAIWTNWVGIGDFDNHLLQNGFWNSNSTDTAFYEAIAPGLDTDVVPIVTQGANYNDRIRILTQWLGNGTVEFIWHDMNTGEASGIRASRFDIGGHYHSASTFYASNVAWAIDERGSSGGYAMPLRNFGYDYWNDVDLALNGGDRQPISGFDPHTFDMVDGSTTYALNGDFSAGGNFWDAWNECGPKTKD